MQAIVFGLRGAAGETVLGGVGVAGVTGENECPAGSTPVASLEDCEVAVPAAALEVGSPSASDRPQGRPFMVEQAIAATAAPKAGPVLGMDGRRWEMLSDGSDEDEPDAGAGMGFSFDRATYGGSLRCRYV